MTVATSVAGGGGVLKYELPGGGGGGSGGVLEYELPGGGVVVVVVSS